ncbi:MAG: restriction endonuclease, partial [Candidatus Bathyarchaeia archaeon]
MSINTLLERKTQVLIELRNYKVLEKEETKDGVLTIVEDVEGKKILIWTTSIADAIGVKHINQMTKYMSSKNIESGIIVSEKYTQSAKSLARKNNIEL